MRALHWSLLVTLLSLSLGCATTGPDAARFEDTDELARLPASATDDEVGDTITVAAMVDTADPMSYSYVTAAGQITSRKFDARALASFLQSAPSSGTSEDDDDAIVDPSEHEQNVGGAKLRRIDRSELDDFPFRAIGRVVTGCSGTLIGRRQVLTAAHCVYNIRTKKYKTLRKLRFRRAEHGRGTGEIFEAASFYVPDDYTVRHLRRADYAMIILEKPVPEAIGRFKFGYSDDLPLTATPVHLIGYPNSYFMHAVTCHAGKAGESRLKYPCNTDEGMSGSSVYMRRGADRVVYGIHSGTYSNTHNAGARITEQVFYQLREWKRKHD